MKMELATEIKREFKSSDTWFAQIFNIMSGLSWFIGTWILATTTLISATGMLLILASDLPESLTLHDVKGTLNALIFFYGFFCALILFTLGLPGRLRNIFLETAQKRVDAYSAVVSEIADEIQTTEALLLAYGLIDESNIVTRKSALPEGRLI